MGSGGTATVVAAPAAAIGAGMIIKGGVEVAVGKMLYSNGSDNYKNQKGRANEDGNNKPTKNERAAEKKSKNSNNSQYGGGAEHTSNARGSTKGKHEAGRARNKQDKGGEKADNKRYRTQDSKK
ncbi:hypothetical protein [Arcicella rosea]|uniref:Uncharacterized protein n=1 Tax=Arcicella rosea TaxID=502909 RepID=A0A841EGS6_9BACT|nr:hypothetical protein [Arcicella rosea]MBB6003397.1 hypothetical protein [Arcicella rosea]